jgi:hypothetical protein
MLGQSRIKLVGHRSPGIRANKTHFDTLVPSLWYAKCKFFGDRSKLQIQLGLFGIELGRNRTDYGECQRNLQVPVQCIRTRSKQERATRTNHRRGMEPTLQ